MFPMVPDETANPTDTLWDARTIYNIPEPCLPKFEKEMAKLSKRSERLIGLPIKPFVMSHEMKDLGGGRAVKVYQVYITAETPKIDGWTFAARIDHSNETGNIIRSVPNIRCEIPEAYRTSQPNCDHCKVKRYRRDTFVIHNDETGEFQQVGTNCLEDFFGHDPYKIARLAEYLGYANEIGHANQEYGEGAGLADLRWIDVEEFLGHTAAAIRLYGWVSGTKAREAEEMGRYLRSSRNRASDSMLSSQAHARLDVTDDDRQMAADALEWARGLSGREDLNEYLNNIMVVAGATYCEPRSLGLAASIVASYQREKGLKRKIVSEWIAEKGEKVSRDVTVHFVSGYQTDFGYTYLYIFRTDDNHMVKWAASNGQGLAEGDRVTITGRVKDLTEYKGVKQTVLTRCKIARL